MPRKKNRRKEIQAKRRAEEAAKAKPRRRVGIVAHHQPNGLSMAALALMVAGFDGAAARQSDTDQ